jgi:hypothetical protein
LSAAARIACASAYAACSFAACSERSRCLRLLERLADRLGALLHLGQQRLVQQLDQDEEQQTEVDHLDDDRLVQADQAASALVGQRRRRHRPEQKRSDGEYASHGEFSGPGAIVKEGTKGTRVSP